LAYLVLLVDHSIFPYELKLNQLQQLLGIGYTVEDTAQVCQCLLMVD
jgi:hypothetical protein